VGIVDLSHIPKDRLEKARERGQKVHEATQYFDEGRLDWSTVDPSLLPYVSAWLAFIDNEGFVVDPMFIEKPTYHKTFFYGIIPDRFGHFRGRRYNGRRAVTEIKNTYTNADYWGIQTSAQAQALHSHGLDIDPKTVLRLAVNLKPDGTYVLEEHEDPNDFRYFMSCLMVYGLKRKKR
jgi:hypothetical protein